MNSKSGSDRVISTLRSDDFSSISGSKLGTFQSSLWSHLMIEEIIGVPRETGNCIFG